MKSISTRGPVAVDESLQSSKSSSRKQGSTTLRSLKESFKFRGSMSPKKNSRQSASTTVSSPSRIRRSSIDRPELRKTKQRFSAQRVSLFKYEYVRVRSYSVLRRDSSSTISSDATRSSDNASYSSCKSRGSVRVKPTTLMAKGVLEVYQIYTPKASPAEKQQEMNYLSLGRKDNIVHPILPRLQVTRNSGLAQRFIIHFYNPDRSWEVEFLESSEGAPGAFEAVSKAVKEFESVISKICNYTVVSETPERRRAALIDVNAIPDLVEETKSRNGSNVIEDKPKSGKKGQDEVDKEEDEDDDLAYLLEEGNKEVQEKEIPNGNQSTSAANRESEDNLQDGAINEAFKKAMENFKPSSYHSYRGSKSEKMGEHHSLRRLSCYQPPNFEEQSLSLSKRFSSLGAKRFSSVPTWHNYEIPVNVTRRGD
ncbi:hypothetical protein HG536_0A08740 [Torulaspora globosa]|uniref:Inheritance of peroxisomes protein 1 n=1 Tax=Torulaspora globosa TaxID=48254 RepID=A0A7G3ZC21_9SACH|nr:uncharacterized protein HG536_0A08740 [Torulaspora globosa]QLL31057.1 hypothetical protein HG536_0A08740 [Torulaspora globosa]